ncbi:molybdate ABC transporter substrate-binding protein [Pacificibacter marinus]|uniref:molybdate ABC transporter substrate-binding protein n=1 Tax=Pacificibacter marinus TaxID=658057 RepID=UPI001C0731BE|nr:molybdate ABC transporter substrate-binding protein [Pacificibacter marinus]MBU2867743.1 molybdate ABC transporter substrate-binding protein [Pacificibacter marinus]
MPIRFICSVIQGAACVLLAGLGSAQADTVTVFAAASLKAALDDVAIEFELVSDHKVLLSFASSSALARQIERGAPANVFISANTDWMDQLATEGLLDADSRVTLLTNQLVLIVPKDADMPKTSIDDIDFVGLLEAGPMAMGFVEAVPAGIYGKSALVNLGLWDSLSTHVAQTDNVRSALALVARGEAPLGIVYATDALSEARVSVVAQFPQASHAPIVYPAAVIAPATVAASEFAAYLASPEARAIFDEHGFGNVDH